MRLVQVRSEMNQIRMMVTEARLARLEAMEVVLTMVSRLTHCPFLGLNFILSQVIIRMLFDHSTLTCRTAEWEAGKCELCEARRKTEVGPPCQ